MVTPVITAEPVEAAAHLIQMALTPVFMLAGIGIMVTIFNQRLEHISGHLEAVDGKIANIPLDALEDKESYDAVALAQQHASKDLEALLRASDASPGFVLGTHFSAKRLLAFQARLHKRVTILDIATILGALAAVFTCLSTLALFVSSFRADTQAHELLACFGIALTLTILSLGAFLIDTVLSWHGMYHDRGLALSILKKRKSIKEAKVKKKKKKA